MIAISDTVDTLVLELGDATFIALASDVMHFKIGSRGNAGRTHDLDRLLGAKTIISEVAVTLLQVDTPAGLVTLTSTARPRFSTVAKETFFRLPKIMVSTCASWVRGVQVYEESVAVWIDFRRLAEGLHAGAPVA